ncbi:MAG TPA: hypothetical protein VMW04_01355 [Patescibacteria group bacterium]|nr:hypothetical protein [Patescibacteria group bacterium]
MKDLFLDIKEHFGHYLVLLFILTFGFGAYFYFRRFPQAQILSAFLTASFYVIWGITHHYLEGDLHWRAVAEYLAIALLGFLILFSLAQRV